MVKLWRIRSSRRSFTLNSPHGPPSQAANTTNSNASAFYRPLQRTGTSPSTSVSYSRAPSESQSEPPPLPTTPPPASAPDSHHKSSSAPSYPHNSQLHVKEETMGCVPSHCAKNSDTKQEIQQENHNIDNDSTSQAQIVPLPSNANYEDINNTPKTINNEEQKHKTEINDGTKDTPKILQSEQPQEKIELENTNEGEKTFKVEISKSVDRKPVKDPEIEEMVTTINNNEEPVYETLPVIAEGETTKTSISNLTDEVETLAKEIKATDLRKQENFKLSNNQVEITNSTPIQEEPKNVKKIGISGESGGSGATLPNRKKKGVSSESTRVGSSRDIEIAKYEKDQVNQDLIRKALEENQFLNFGVDSKQLQQRVIDAMYIKNVPAACTIIQEGEAGSELYVCAKGSFDVFKGTQKVNTLGPGTVFGELAVLYHSKRNATIKATSDSSLWVLERKVFHKIMMKAGMERQDENIKFLRSVPLLRTLDKGSLVKMSDLLKMEYFSSGEDIIVQGDAGSKFYIITRGKVKVVAKRPDGVTELSLQKGDFFGERALINDDKRAATVTAMDGGTECLVLDRGPFMELLGSLEVLQQAASKGKTETRHSDAKLVSEYDHVKLTDLTVVGTLGVGGFGRVELVRSKAEGEHKNFALKRIKKIVILEQQQQEHIFNEKEIMLACRSPFIARLYKTYHDRKYLFLLMEACMGGDVWTLLQKYHYFDEATAQFMTGCVIEGLDYLHTRGIVYRDLKPENMMLDATGYIKLVDFGFAKKIGLSSKTWTFAGTPEYLAPEIIRNKGHDRATDYWSLGVFVHELLVGRPPFRGHDHHRTYNMILKGIDYVPFPAQIQKPAALLIRKLCRSLPTERLGYQKEGINGIRNHKWFQGFDWGALQATTMKAPIVPRLQGSEDVSNFEKYPKDKDIPPDEVSGWDADF